MVWDLQLTDIHHAMLVRQQQQHVWFLQIDEAIQLRAMTDQMQYAGWN
jgi:hypothetical protein